MVIGATLLVIFSSNKKALRHLQYNHSRVKATKFFNFFAFKGLVQENLGHFVQA